MASEGLRPGYDKAHTGASGGGQLGRSRDFVKTPDRFRGGPLKTGTPTDESWGKSGAGAGARPVGKSNKVLPTPR